MSKPNGHDERVKELAVWVRLAATTVAYAFSENGADVKAFGGGLVVAHYDEINTTPVLTCYPRDEAVAWHKAIAADLGGRFLDRIREYADEAELPNGLLTVLAESVWDNEPNQEVDTALHPENHSDDQGDV